MINMLRASLYQDLEYKDKPVMNVLFETEVSKEIRIALKKGVEMKKHQAPFTIVIEVVEGCIDFGFNNELLILNKGDMISLGPKIPHNLMAKQDSFIRLTLNKQDKIDRVANVI